VRDLIRTLHYSYRTEEAFLNWIRQYILFHGSGTLPRWELPKSAHS
jgi:hypothetical protein